MSTTAFEHKHLDQKIFNIIIMKYFVELFLTKLFKKNTKLFYFMFAFLSFFQEINTNLQNCFCHRLNHKKHQFCQAFLLKLLTSSARL